MFNIFCFLLFTKEQVTGSDPKFSGWICRRFDTSGYPAFPSNYVRGFEAKFSGHFDYLIPIFLTKESDGNSDISGEISRRFNIYCFPLFTKENVGDFD